MRSFVISILILISFTTLAQTPFDSFAPEVSKPILGLKEPALKPETKQYAVVADLQSETLLLVDVSCNEVVATAPISDDLSKWLSVDPLADNYPGISPYAYAAWNPIKFIDPDGRTYVINTNGKTEKIDDGKNNHVVLNANNSRERVEIYLTKGNILELCSSKSAEGNVNLLRMENLDVANELYEAMGMNMTMLEFNVVSAHSGDEYLYYVGNTQDSQRTGIGNYVFDILGQTIDYMKHFHPTNPKASNADKLRAESVYRNAKDYPQANPNAKLYITYRNEEGELKDVEY